MIMKKEVLVKVYGTLFKTGIQNKWMVVLLMVETTYGYRTGLIALKDASVKRRNEQRSW